MTNLIFATARAACALLDAGFTRAIHQLWISTLLAQRRHGHRF
jgi:hypothetical protein